MEHERIWFKQRRSKKKIIVQFVGTQDSTHTAYVQQMLVGHQPQTRFFHYFVFIFNCSVVGL